MPLQALSPMMESTQAGPSGWTAQGLQTLVDAAEFGQVMVVSCREPYSHDDQWGGVRVTSPVSGLVTALEPVVRACGGTWIAHGSGTADAAFVNADGVCPVPPEDPAYSLRRVWLDDEEKRRFLDGFANQSLWPLCHRSDVTPSFQALDWRHYRRVNERFAEAVAQSATQRNPLILVQDYHFALLPELIRARLPEATVVTFWHIPWPTFGELEHCPWWPALVRGLMSSSIVGFQTERDRANFEHATEMCHQHTQSGASLPVAGAGAGAGTGTGLGVGVGVGVGAQALLASYPISVAWPLECELRALPDVAECRRQVLRENGLPPHTRLIVGVDRFDYTKGLLHKVRAVEWLLEHQPKWRGVLSLVQVAAPTRCEVPAYASYQRLVRAEVQRINRRFVGAGALPIVLLESQHDRAAVSRLYRAACVCAVTSLHDGMNLVSKEFVSLRDDGQGVLVLSALAGAAEELGADALLVNPLNTAALADALARALTMAPAEQQHRMDRMRRVVRQANIYRWAGHMLKDAATVRGQQASRAPKRWAKAA